MGVGKDQFAKDPRSGLCPLLAPAAKTGSVSKSNDSRLGPKASAHSPHPVVQYLTIASRNIRATSVLCPHAEHPSRDMAPVADVE